jgi:hypothetical protein
MTDQSPLIAVAKVENIYYDNAAHPDIMHIGCPHPATQEHIVACGFHDPRPFDSKSIDDSPEEFVCLGCIVATEKIPDGYCWRSPQQLCTCGDHNDIVT